MLMVVSSFLLPPNAGEKLTINSVCFLGMFVWDPSTFIISILFLVCVLFLLYFQTALPAMSDHIPLIVMFYRLGKIDQIIIHSYLLFSNTGALVGIAIVLNITCISLARERRFVVKYFLKHHLPSYFRYSGPPKCLRNFFSGFMGRVLCLSNYYHQVGMIKIWNLLLNCYPRFLTLIKDW